MKKLTFLLLIAITTVFIGCEFSENIYINDDGTGKMSFQFDASELMKVSGDAMTETTEKALDSTIVFKELLEEKKDSISELSKEDQEALKALEDFSVHMVMNPENQEMKFDMYTDFNDVNELQDMMTAMNIASSLNEEDKGDNPFSSMVKAGSTKMEYSFKNGIFKRKAEIADKEAHKQALDSLGQAEMMFAASNYSLNYHFSKPIKSVSNEKAMFSADKKSFKLEVSYLDYLKDPGILNLEVVLED